MSMEKVHSFSSDDIGGFLFSKFCWAKKKINTNGLLRLNMSPFILFPFCEFEYFLWFLHNDNEVNYLGYAAKVNYRVQAKTKLWWLPTVCDGEDWSLLFCLQILTLNFIDTELLVGHFKLFIQSPTYFNLHSSGDNCCISKLIEKLAQYSVISEFVICEVPIFCN